MLLLSALLCTLSLTTPAQQSAAEVAAGLRAQLADVKAQQAELQARLQTLDEALKPENIQNSLAGVGSTRPEELREQRRRQLEKEKAGVVTQLERLATSERRLESTVAAADAAAYQQSAQPNVAPNTTDLAPSTKRSHRRRRTKSKKPTRKKVSLARVAQPLILT
jgi:oligoendopeptidase F